MRRTRCTRSGAGTAALWFWTWLWQHADVHCVGMSCIRPDRAPHVTVTPPPTPHPPRSFHTSRTRKTNDVWGFLNPPGHRFLERLQMARGIPMSGACLHHQSPALALPHDATHPRPLLRMAALEPNLNRSRAQKVLDPGAWPRGVGECGMWRPRKPQASRP